MKIKKAQLSILLSIDRSDLRKNSATIPDHGLISSLDPFFSVTPLLQAENVIFLNCFCQVGEFKVNLDRVKIGENFPSKIIKTSERQYSNIILRVTCLLKG